MVRPMCMNQNNYFRTSYKFYRLETPLIGRVFARDVTAAILVPKGILWNLSAVLIQIFPIALELQYGCRSRE